MVDQFANGLARRGEITPILFGAKGDRFDLVISSLFFRGSTSDKLSMAEHESLTKEGRGLIIPLNLGFTARDFPIVGTTADYYTSRSLSVKSGSIPLIIGDAVLGYRCANDLEKKVGDFILSDQVNLYDLSASYPIKMKIVGILNPSDSPDDTAVFTSLQTTWILSGLGHGHEKLNEKSPKEQLLGISSKQITANASVEQFIEFTDENIDQFHFHSDKKKLPITSIIAFPKNLKDSTLLKGKYKSHQILQPLTPGKVIDELLRVVFKLKRFFDSAFTLTVLATLLLLTVIILLSLQTRKREWKALFLMGCSRGTVVFIYSAELAMLSLAALSLALIAAFVLLLSGSDILHLIG